MIQLLIPWASHKAGAGKMSKLDAEIHLSRGNNICTIRLSIVYQTIYALETAVKSFAINNNLITLY